MENIKIKLVFKSPLLKANLGLIVQNFMILWFKINDAMEMYWGVEE
jgi:uncharacterized protein with PQ loop repeat